MAIVGLSPMFLHGVKILTGKDLIANLNAQPLILVSSIMILASGDPSGEITAAMLPSEAGSNGSAASGSGIEHLLVHPLREAREAFERDYITAQLGRFGGNISKTAMFIGMERSALHRKIKLLGLTGRGEEEAD